MATLSLFQRSSTQWLDRQVDSGRISPSRRASGRRGFFRYVKDGEDKRQLTSNLLIRRWSRYGISVALTSEEAYGNKEVISLTPWIYDYVLSNVREPVILRELLEEIASMRGSQGILCIMIFNLLVENGISYMRNFLFEFVLPLLLRIGEFSSSLGQDILEINHPVGPFGTKLIGFYKSKLCTLHLLRCFPAHSLKSNVHASNRFKKKDTRREK
ncbi:hypothetical protein QQ045_016103 [Rhodiola kirilowii]